MSNKKAKVISVIGAGGKTTLVFNMARDYAARGNSVLVTTTTHMLDENFYHSLDEALSDKSENGMPKKKEIYKIGTSAGDRVASLSEDDLNRARELFDYIIVEADGSRCMPIKKPAPGREPVILDDSLEIHVVAGCSAIGRKFKVVCHRYNLITQEEKNEIKKLFCKDNEDIDNLIVTKEMLEYCAKKFYIEPLSKEYKDAKFITHLVDMKESKNYKSYKKIAFVNLASGSSVRFTKSVKDCVYNILKDSGLNLDGKILKSDKLIKLASAIDSQMGKKSYVNKLLVTYRGKPVYEHLLTNEISARKIVIDYFKNECGHNIKIDIGIVTPFSKLSKGAKKIYKDVKIIPNNIQNEGIASSIKKSVQYFKNYDGIVFFNADYVNLNQGEISKFVINSILNYTASSMMCNEEADAVVPAFASKEVFDEIKKISGDKGAKKILSKEPCYLYHIENIYLKDIDDIKDILL